MGVCRGRWAEGEGPVGGDRIFKNSIYTLKGELVMLMTRPASSVGRAQGSYDPKSQTSDWRQSVVTLWSRVRAPGWAIFCTVLSASFSAPPHQFAPPHIFFPLSSPPSPPSLLPSHTLTTPALVGLASALVGDCSISPLPHSTICLPPTPVYPFPHGLTPTPAPRGHGLKARCQPA